MGQLCFRENKSCYIDDNGLHWDDEHKRVLVNARTWDPLPEGSDPKLAQLGTPEESKELRDPALPQQEDKVIHIVSAKKESQAAEAKPEEPAPSPVKRKRRKASSS